MKELKFAFDFGHPVDAWDSVVIRLLSEAKHLNALTSVAAKVRATITRMTMATSMITITMVSTMTTMTMASAMMTMASAMITITVASMMMRA